MSLLRRKKMIFINKNQKNKNSQRNKKEKIKSKIAKTQWTVLIILLGAIKVKK